MKAPSLAPDAPRTSSAALSADDPSRVAWVDTAKGICIILVVMMHSTLGVGEAMGGEGFMHWVVAFSRPFRMPDFFMVSGLFLSRVIDRDWRLYADRRVVHFLYFYLLWLVIQSGVKYGQVSGGSPLGFLEHLAYGLVEPYSTLWFIYLLAIFSVVTKLLRRVPAFVLLGVAAGLQSLPLDTASTVVNEFCARWVFFLAGYIFAPQIFRLARHIWDRPVFALIGLPLWALVNGALALTPSPWQLFPTLASLPFISLALGVAGAVAIMALATLLTRTGWAGWLRYCGQNSIAIYLAFFLPMALTRTILIRTGIITDIGWVSFIVTAMAVIVPLVLERLVRNTSLFFLFRRPAAFHIVAPKPQAGASRLQAAE